MARGRTVVSGVKKAAVLLMSVPAQDASSVLRHLNRSEVERIAVEIANTPRIERELQEAVLKEFYHLSLAEAEVAKGGLETARALLERAFDPSRAGEILARLTALMQHRPFEVLRKADPAQVLAFVQNEHPQTIAVLLAYMDPAQASQVLSALPDELKGEVARRIAVMDRVSPEMIKEIEALIEKRLQTLSVEEVGIAGGIQSLVPIISNADRTAERTILSRLEEDDPELAEEVRARLFVFENIVQLDDRSIQKVLRRVDNKTLATALKGTAEEVSQKVFRNLSQKAAELLRDDMAVMGPVRIRDVEQAQREIIHVIRQLEEQGEIVISRGNEEDDYVV
ncbi:MAG: flagellar motor switch protein FliG [Firmicutes bacterium]|nr:flagellar motor switch protein FliG [Bacillota bacterium]